MLGLIAYGDDWHQSRVHILQNQSNHVAARGHKTPDNNLVFCIYFASGANYILLILNLRK